MAKNIGSSCENQGQGDQHQNKTADNRMGTAFTGFFQSGKPAFFGLLSGIIIRFSRTFLLRNRKIVCIGTVIPGRTAFQFPDRFLRCIGKRTVRFTGGLSLSGIIINKVIRHNRTAVFRRAFQTSFCGHLRNTPFRIEIIIV